MVEVIMKFKFIDFVIGGLFATIGALGTEHVIPMLVMFVLGTLVSEAYRGTLIPRPEELLATIALLEAAEQAE